MKVKIELYATLRDKYKTKEIVLKNLIEQASKVLGKNFFDEIYDKEKNSVRDDRIFTINGRNIKDIKGDSFKGGRCCRDFSTNSWWVE